MYRGKIPSRELIIKQRIWKSKCKAEATSLRWTAILWFLLWNSWNVRGYYSNFLFCSYGKSFLLSSFSSRKKRSNCILNSLVLHLTRELRGLRKDREMNYFGGLKTYPWSIFIPSSIVKTLYSVYDLLCYPAADTQIN